MKSDNNAIPFALTLTTAKQLYKFLTNNNADLPKELLLLHNYLEKKIMDFADIQDLEDLFESEK